MPRREPFPPDFFARYDESPDHLFYTHPRLTTHMDDHAVAALSAFLAQTLPAQGHVLDLMSSYRSHLPPDPPLAQVVGLGLNAEELRQNHQLDQFVLHDLNREPRMPFPDASFDAVLCTVSVQYLTHPVEVFADVGRVLRPGGPFIVSFSNRCFPSKAVRIWLTTSFRQHGELVASYLQQAACFKLITLHALATPCWPGDPLWAVQGQRTADVL